MGAQETLDKADHALGDAIARDMDRRILGAPYPRGLEAIEGAIMEACAVCITNLQGRAFTGAKETAAVLLELCVVRGVYMRADEELREKRPHHER